MAAPKHTHPELQEQLTELKLGVDQLRHIFGLNGDLSSEAAELTWDRMQVLAAATKQRQDLDDAIRVVLSHFAAAIHLRAIVALLKWTLLAVGSAVLWQFGQPVFAAAARLAAHLGIP